MRLWISYKHSLSFFFSTRTRMICYCYIRQRKSLAGSVMGKTDIMSLVVSCRNFFLKILRSYFFQRWNQISSMSASSLNFTIFIANFSIQFLMFLISFSHLASGPLSVFSSYKIVISFYLRGSSLMRKRRRYSLKVYQNLYVLRLLSSALIQVARSCTSIWLLLRDEAGGGGITTVLSSKLRVEVFVLWMLMVLILVFRSSSFRLYFFLVVFIRWRQQIITPNNTIHNTRFSYNYTLPQQFLFIMFQFFSSFAASTNFEKCRLQITAKNLDAPNQQPLRGIIATFSGQDPETKSQIAFATVVKKLMTSDSRGNWLYVIKNLIILDRIADEGYFAEEIGDLSVATLDNYKENEQKNAVFDSERVIASYWRLIKQRSKAVWGGQHIFCYKRSQRTEFLLKLKPTELLSQIQSIESFFALTFDFVLYLSGRKLMSERPQGQERIERGREEWSSSKLLEYLYLQVLQKLMLYYSCQLLCNQAFLQLLSKDGTVKVEDVRLFKRQVLRFKLNANEYIRYVQARKQIRGFQQINYKQLNPYKGDDIVKLLDAFIQHKEKEAESERPVFGCLLNDEEMRVEKKPFANLNTNLITPRLKHREKSSAIESNNCFTNWTNSFSSSFPQSEVLSVDLIMEIKKEEGKENVEEGEIMIDESNRESVAYGSRDTNVAADYQVTEKLWPQYKPVPFANCYSPLASKWNY